MVTRPDAFSIAGTMFPHEKPSGETMQNKFLSFIKVAGIAVGQKNVVHCLERKRQKIAAVFFPNEHFQPKRAPVNQNRA
ncbi:MAG: hypothetical protein II814_08480, partial [Treponema sp.]|nr:hypothetical protein [Treponema sp.]